MCLRRLLNLKQAASRGLCSVAKPKAIATLITDTVARVPQSKRLSTAPTGGRTESHTVVYARAGLERHPPAHKEVDLPGRARDPVRISIRPVHALHVTCRPDAAPIARVPDQLFDPRLGT